MDNKIAVFRRIYFTVTVLRLNKFTVILWPIGI